MALDVGKKRVGIASTDESGQFALPRLVLPNDEHLLDAILELKLREGVEKVVLGESLNLAGEPNEIMGEVERLKSELDERGVETLLHPEMLSTVEARRLQGNTAMTDASAAAIILKSFLDSHKDEV